MSNGPDGLTVLYFGGEMLIFGEDIMMEEVGHIIMEK